MEGGDLRHELKHKRGKNSAGGKATKTYKRGRTGRDIDKSASEVFALAN